jgi:hypothetical protein
MQVRLRTVPGKTVAVASLVLAFVLVAGTAFAALTFNSTAITSDGALTLNPTGQPVTVNGNVVLTGSATTPASLTVSGSDSDISLKLSGKGRGFIQAGPDTFGISGWAGYNMSEEIYRTASTQPNVLELYMDSTLGDFANGQIGGIELHTRTQGVGATHDLNSNGAIYAVGESDLPSGRTIFGLNGGNMQAYATGGGTATDAQGLFTQVLADTGSVIQNGKGVETWIYNLTPNNDSGVGYDYYGKFLNVNTMHEAYGLWLSDMGGIATNPYYSWFDSRGVGRCKEDNTFNTVGQSICTVYNPQFTKYTPGASNYERIVYGQWNSNVAEMGPEAGGTGTLRPLKLLGSQLTVPSHVNTGSSNNDLDGTISISSSTSASYTFATAFNSAPSCVIVPTTDPTSLGAYWVTATTSALTAHIHTSGSLTFNYHCVGNPN